MRVLRSIRSSEISYASTPITSSRSMYENILEHGPQSRERTVSLNYTLNYNKGWEFVEGLTKRVTHPVVFPADMTPARQNWEQPHFMALWLSIIGEKITDIHMNNEWEYSNGCADEFVHAMQLRLGVPRDKDLLFFNTKKFGRVGKGTDAFYKNL